ACARSEIDSQRMPIPKTAKREAGHVSHHMVGQVVENPNAKQPQRQRTLIEPAGCANGLRLYGLRLDSSHLQVVERAGLRGTSGRTCRWHRYVSLVRADSVSHSRAIVSCG